MTLIFPHRLATPIEHLGFTTAVTLAQAGAVTVSARLHLDQLIVSHGHLRG
ncbi:hypothetical protein KBD61_02150 [Patescibacteria group bacterium]|nr:hypothetical protein [Patescibacteria group bacterium]MBP9709811.1 hypothetical protein [Patescibacteria group bacterium]